MTTTCPLCAATSLQVLADRVRFERAARVLRCDGCSLVFLDQDSFRFPEDFYQHAYHQTYLTHVDPDMLDPARHHQKMSAASRPWIERVRAKLSGAERVLDVGCSTGHVLTGIRDRAAAVYGHELNRAEIVYCREQHGLDVADTPLEERFEPASFDYILLIFVLEHIGQPVEFLQNLQRFLKPTGKLLIVVPNILDPLLQLYRIPEYAGFHFCIEHLFYYSPRTIAELFRRAGLHGSIEAAQEYPITNHLNWGYRRRPAETLAARRAVPDIELADAGRMAGWEQFWGQVNRLYQEYLGREGLADRIWCEVRSG